MRYLGLLLLSGIFLLTFGKTAYTQTEPSSEIKMDTMTLFDASRNRNIPVALYYPHTAKIPQAKELIILSHGYGANQGGDYMGYSYLTTFLASKGYTVISIQHELPTDSLLPATGVPQLVRRTNWERGAANILFVANTVKKKYQKLNYKHLTLIGHSNGGDMSMLFCSMYPERADKVISLDNRRVALPRTKHPKVYSLRSSDQPADEGVLPTAEEQKRYGMQIIKLNNTIHNNMDDDATPEQRKEINNYILGFLKDH